MPLPLGRTRNLLVISRLGSGHYGRELLLHRKWIFIEACDFSVSSNCPVSVVLMEVKESSLLFCPALVVGLPSGKADRNQTHHTC